MYYAIFGDFNSRTSILPDVVDFDNINLCNIDILPEGYESDIIIQRYSQDQGHVNHNGKLFQNCEWLKRK